jgi:integrase
MPRIAAQLTLVTIRKALADPKAQTGRIELNDGGCAGLRLRVSPHGASWSLRLVLPNGDRKRFELGDYPALSLTDARAQGDDLRHKVKRGEDPSKERDDLRKRTAAAKTGAGTLDEIIESYKTAGAGKQPSWYDADKRMRSVFAALFDKPAIDIEAEEFQKCVDGHPKSSSAAAAVRYVKPMLKWAAKRKLVKKNVYYELEQPIGAFKKRKRFLADKELTDVLKVLGYERYDGAARFLLLTAARREEVGAMDWGEINFTDRTWTIPAAHRKGKPEDRVELTVPLSRQAYALLERTPKEGRSGLVFKAPRGGALINWSRWQAGMFARSKTSGWHRHDLRRTCTTIAGNLGFAPHITETMLGHKNIHSALAATYNLAKYVPEHLAALQAVADHLDKLAAQGGQKNY